MQKTYGKIFKIIRESKNMSLKEAAADAISPAQLSRFERGISSLTIESFYRCLENLSVSLDEFQCVYDQYTETSDLAFSNKLTEAYRDNNLILLQEMLQDCMALEEQFPKKTKFKLNTIIVRTFLSYCDSDFQVGKKDIDFLTDYLFSIAEWGRYELWLFTNCLDLLTFSAVETFASEMIQRTQFYYKLPENRKRILKMLLSVVGSCIEAGHLNAAMKFLNYTDNLKLSESDLYERLLIKYYKALYSHAVGDSAGGKEMEHCLSALEYLGAYRIAQKLREQQDRIQKDKVTYMQ